MEQKNYDLIIIGGGPAGYLAAERAGESGLAVLLFEKRKLGGVCLNEGCIPTKSLLNTAKIYAKALHGDVYGVEAEQLKLDHNRAVKRKNKVVKMLVEGVKAKMRANKVDVIYADAYIKGKAEEGFVVAAEGMDYQAKTLLLAAGSEPVVLPVPGLSEAIESGFAITSREILDIDHVPKKMVIVGGGVIGLEMADYFKTVGSAVTVVELLNKIAGPFDAKVSTMLQEHFTNNGVEFRLGSRVTEVGYGSVTVETDGVTENIETDRVLLSVGRRPAADGLGLENIGVYLENGAVVTDNQMRTNIPGVFAAGDINGKSMLAHTAYREAETAVNNMLGKKDVMSYNVIPSVIYTTPEAASVGETEETAKAKGIDCDKKQISMMYSGRYVAENDRLDGICTVIIEKSSQRLLGVQLVGTYASEIILAAGVMIESRMPLESLKKTVFAHPTVGEIIREAIFC